mmetsp:Transcript_28752/g.62711  ORF Transcript_28752/g.62711 Transcript_28752/m.62711 type:complete len:201 (-) Transcript_28752:60-662(-)
MNNVTRVFRRGGCRTRDCKPRTHRRKCASTVQKLLWRLAQLKSRGGGTRCLDNETGAVAHIGVQVLVQPAGDGALRMRLVAAAGFDVALTIGLAIGRRGAWNPAPSLALLLALADVAASGTAVGCRNFSQVSAATLDVEVLCTQPCMLCSRRRRRRGRDFALAAAALKRQRQNSYQPQHGERAHGTGGGADHFGGCRLQT